MSRVVIERLVTDISKITFEKEKKVDESSESIEKLIENFKNHIDKRFLEILEKPTYEIVGDNLNIKFEELQKHSVARDSENSYSVLFDIDFPKFKNKNLYIDIRSSDTFQSLTNTLYFMISDHVNPFAYLEEWVIVEQKTNKHVIIREIAECISATSIFEPNTKWRILKLAQPYIATDSSIRIKS
jgi:hypothetical protein